MIQCVCQSCGRQPLITYWIPIWKLHICLGCAQSVLEYLIRHNLADNNPFFCQFVAPEKSRVFNDGEFIKVWFGLDEKFYHTVRLNNECRKILGIESLALDNQLGLCYPIVNNEVG